MAVDEVDEHRERERVEILIEICERSRELMIEEYIMSGGIPGGR